MKARTLFSFQLAVLLCVCIFSHAQVALPDSLSADTTGYGTFQPGDEIVFEEELPDGESMTDENGWDATLPGLYSSGNNVVGSIASQFGVSALGAATGTISFRLPAGVGGLLPSTGIGYNSQSGNGVAGMGCSITGLSAITRAPRTVWYDNQAKSVNYTAEDAFFLDGIRLKYLSGIRGEEGCVYVMENDPFTRVVVHGSYSNGNDDTWFEVQLRDGRTLWYGSTTASRQTFTSNGISHTAAWYIDRTEDAQGNYITYTYIKENLYIYPSLITYGGNTHTPTVLTNTITFTYEQRTDVQPFKLKNVSGQMAKRLQGVTIQSNGQTYRTYECTYESAQASPVSMLIRVTEKNGSGDQLNPMTMNWYPGVQHEQNIETAMLPQDSGTHIKNRSYSAADLNGDGLADLIEMRTYTNSDTRKTIIIYTGGFNSKGHRVFTHTNDVFEVSDYQNGDDIHLLGMFGMGDVNGDGYIDIIRIIHDVEGSVVHRVLFGYLSYNTSIGHFSYNVPNHHSKAMKGSSVPIYTVLDINNNGISNIAILEKDKENGKYPLHLVDLNSPAQTSPSNYRYQLITLPADPDNIISGDFNNDGLTDLIIFHNNSYTILYNKGTSDIEDAFEDNIKTVHNNFGHCNNIWQGDFNGDGLVDFLLRKSKTYFYFALNNGDGTFTSQLAYSYSSFPSYGQEDAFGSAQILDFNHDGKSDAVLVWGDHIDWLTSDGNSLTLKNRKEKESSMPNLMPSPLKASQLFTADFTGDGSQQLMSVGVNCYSDTPADTIARLYLHTTKDFKPHTQKLRSVIDGYGRSTTFHYTSLTDSNAYTPFNINEYSAAHEMTAPLTVVSRTLENNGAAGTGTKTYRYSGLKVNRQGRGIIGFAKTIANDLEHDVTNETHTTWETTFFAPLVQQVTSRVGSQQSVQTSTFALSQQGTGNDKAYFLYPASAATTDFDGYETQTTYTYDTGKGVPLTETVTYDNDASFFKRQTYSAYTLSGRQWLPATILSEQQHEDAGDIYAVTTTLVYDSLGRKTSETVLAGTDKALTTACTYDAFGNVLASTVSGSDISTVTTHSEYDATGRFLTGKYTTPSSVVNSYTYDLWGNVLTETDNTDAQHPSTITHTYNGWGTLTCTVHPDGTRTSYASGWSTADPKRYFTVEQPNNAPWTKKWYDKTGRQTGEETSALDGRIVTTTYSYNSKGEHTGTVTTDGLLTTTENMVYDGRGRMTSKTSSTGANTTWQYSGRTVTETDGEHVVTRTADAWGNVRTVTDAGGTLSYTYASNGKPARVDFGNDSTTLSYDIAGNRTRLRDSDAGVTLITYDALGNVLTQTDARGTTTENSYDALNRMVESETDGIITTYTYGTSGNALQRLVSKQRGNMTLDYTYDDQGRVATETRTTGVDSYTTSYVYDSKGLLTQINYPGNVTVQRQYDALGNHRRTSLSGGSTATSLWELQEGSGMRTKVKLGSQLILTRQHDSRGYLSSITMKKGTQTLHGMAFTYDGTTGNLTSREGVNGLGTEQFQYDNLDRLTEVSNRGLLSSETEYDDNGNISYKHEAGSYLYHSLKQHAVEQVDNSLQIISTETQQTAYNAHGKIAYIEEGENTLTFFYGPDNERWQTTMMRDGEVMKTITFLGDYERVDTAGITHEYWYVADGVILYRQTPQVGQPSAVTPLYALTDNLGSYVRLYTENGTAVFSAGYDAWGQQYVNAVGSPPAPLSSFTFHRGYTGHEMLPAFGLINMNGRLYDPLLGRFLSPDNYVQAPENSQNFNRYSYCLNNPLKYVDPSGEVFGFFTGFIRGLWKFVFKGGSIKEPFKQAWKDGTNNIKLVWGLFKGNFGQLISRFSWELPQTVVGLVYSTARISIARVDKVRYFDGATFVIRKTNNRENGVTIGSYININYPEIPYENGRFAPYKIPLYMHEYGHYLQSQNYGWGYLFSVGIPSVWSAYQNRKNQTDKHRFKWFEKNANKKAKEYFENKYNIDWNSSYYNYRFDKWIPIINRYPL